jgi:hypothetical protein
MIVKVIFKMKITENILMDFLEELEIIESEMNNNLSKSESSEDLSDNKKCLTEAHDSLLKTISIIDETL